MLVVSMTAAIAQSSMTDQQIMEYVIEEQQKGTSQSQIVTKLMQRGVTIDQIRSVKDKYERQMNNQGLGVKDITTTGKNTDRLRKNNGNKKQSANVSQYRIKDGNIKEPVKNTYDRTELFHA